MNRYMDMIRKTDLLRTIPEDRINAYFADGSFQTVNYGPNSVVHFEGEFCSKLDIIISGKVSVERIDSNGGLLSIAEFYSNDILGGNLLFSQNPYYPMTIMSQDPTVILKINKERLFEIFSENQNLLRIYLEFISDHAYLLGNKIRHYVNRTIRESVISFLKYEYKNQNSNHIRLNMTKKALAEKIGVQRTSLSRELAKMKKDGLILYDDKSIAVIQSDLLK